MEAEMEQLEQQQGGWSGEEDGESVGYPQKVCGPGESFELR